MCRSTQERPAGLARWPLLPSLKKSLMLPHIFLSLRVVRALPPLDPGYHLFAIVCLRPLATLFRVPRAALGHRPAYGPRDPAAFERSRCSADREDPRRRIGRQSRIRRWRHRPQIRDRGDGCPGACNTDNAHHYPEQMSHLRRLAPTRTYPLRAWLRPAREVSDRVGRGDREGPPKTRAAQGRD